MTFGVTWYYPIYHSAVSHTLSTMHLCNPETIVMWFYLKEMLNRVPSYCKLKQ